MKPDITLGLLCALFSEVAALTCYQCVDGISQTCTSTQTCSAGSCASMTVNAYAGDTKTEVAIVRTCLPVDKCISGLMNLGKSTISTECCKTDLCNSQKTPSTFKVNTNMTANGKTCFTCEGDDCTKQLSCGGNEDHCVKTTANVSGQTVTLKGCTSRAMCTVDLSGFLDFGVNCCKEDLCNSAKSVGQSVLLLLGSLVSVLLFH